jgi:hypothetical protein
MRNHQVPSKHRDNVRKQAQQIRYCLVQAREYFTAAATVTLATKPNLLYYGTMSLALAEVLFKQSGESSLDKARAENRHHGLSMTVGGFPKNSDLPTVSQQLRAVPITVEGKRKGTFELWHRTSREHPIAGVKTNHFATGGSNSGFNVVFEAIDEPYPPIPDSGLTLAEALSSIPLMAERVHPLGLPAELARGTVSLDTRGDQEWSATYNLLLHPSPLNVKIIENIFLNPNNIDRVDCFEIGAGLQIVIRTDWINGPTSIPLPPAAMIDNTEWRMWANKPRLNEFGFLYLALFLAGNYARYFPDKWLFDVEVASPLGLAIEELCAISEWRAPWLTFCELDMTLFVREV